VDGSTKWAITKRFGGVCLLAFTEIDYLQGLFGESHVAVPVHSREQLFEIIMTTRRRVGAAFDILFDPSDKFHGWRIPYAQLISPREF
jgi:hypothetical protein